MLPCTESTVRSESSIGWLNTDKAVQMGRLTVIISKRFITKSTVVAISNRLFYLFWSASYSLLEVLMLEKETLLLKCDIELFQQSAYENEVPALYGNKAF